MKTLLVAGACLFALSGRRHDRSAPESGPWSGSVRFAFDFDRFTSGSGPSRQCRRRTRRLSETPEQRVHRRLLEQSSKHSLGGDMGELR